MVIDHQRQKNVNDTSNTTGGIALNTTTAVKIADANESRIFFSIDNESIANRVRLKLQAASVDDLVEGIIVNGGSSWEMPTDNIYTGEISAIAETDNPTVSVTEY